MATKIENTLFGKIDYYKDRTSCPKCNSDNVKMDLTPVESGIDKNKAVCNDCKWEGQIHDLTIRKD